METGKAIYKLLKDSAAVGAICGDRVYPELAQQDAATPYVVYTVVDTEPSATKNTTSKLDTARVELYCVGGDYAEIMDLGIAVRGALDRYSGTVQDVEVQSIDFDTSDVQYDPDQELYILEHTYDTRVLLTGTAVSVAQFPSNTFTVEEVDGTPSGAVNKLKFSNGTVTLDGTTATIAAGFAFDALSFRMSAQYLSGGASAIDYNSTTPRGVKFDEQIWDVSSSIAALGESFRVTVTGYYRFTANVVFTSTGQRVTPIIEFQVNSTAVEGQSYGYIRALNDQFENSGNISRVLKLTANDVVELVAYDSSNINSACYVTQAVCDVERLS